MELYILFGSAYCPFYDKITVLCVVVLRSFKLIFCRSKLTFVKHSQDFIYWNLCYNYFEGIGTIVIISMRSSFRCRMPFPPTSPGLIAIIFFIAMFHKRSIIINHQIKIIIEPITPDNMKNHIKNNCQSIFSKTLERVQLSFKNRINQCI